MQDGNLISILLVGIGGYGNLYVDELLKNMSRGDFIIAGAVDPIPQNCRNFQKLKEMKIPIFLLWKSSMRTQKLIWPLYRVQFIFTASKPVLLWLNKATCYAKSL